VETTAFYVVTEALTNAARHAGATEVVVRVSSDGRRLTVTVSDDGRGGADPSGGSGLRGLADRVAAIGGRLSVTSQPGEGTTVAAELPLE
jgi:signal transduction histidine kinase